MAESPPPVRVTTTGVKTDYAERVPRSVKTPLPEDAPRVVGEAIEEDDRD